MDVLVPFSAARPKTRLSDTLDPGERRAFAEAMLVDVLASVVDAGGAPRVLSTHEIELCRIGGLGTDERVERMAGRTEQTDGGTGQTVGRKGQMGGSIARETPVTVDDRDLTTAVNHALETTVGSESTGSNTCAVVMSDLALATPKSLCHLFEADGDVVIAPGRGGGTNALVVRHPEFRVDYHGASIRDHRRITEAIGANATEIDSHRLATDIDERGDLAEVLLHGGGASRRWLVNAGFKLDTSAGRVTVTRR